MKTIEKNQGQQTSNEAILNSIITTGDLSRLTPEQKVDYYRTFCERLGLDPISQPFKLLRLNGREILYCDRTGAQQLNKLHSVSHEIRAREIVNGCYVVTSQASTPDGRHTESIGAVPIENLKGDNLCNAMMKAETKAKRRATLDLLGLGILDETEADVIAPVEAKLPAPVAPKAESTPVPEAPVAEAPKAEERPVELPKAEAPVVVEKIAETAPVEAEKPKKAPVAKASEKLKMLKPDAEITDPMKTKYTTPATLETALGKAYTITHLSDLYYNNIELIEKNAAMKALFTARKLQITNGTLQADAMAA
ncbi:MAG: hypothetical protein EOP52_11985 [Sphingobacteriales bacterium]|nr:MAG: hypothetical protein EOP52_11985 [Sphingobacteriales bacterium]